MEKQKEVQENKMGTMPINKLLISMSLPMIISMLVQAMYNVVDSIFVSRLGEDALVAVSLAFPIQNLMIAVAVGTSVGINALLSRCLGEKKFKEANLCALNGVFLAVLSYIVFAIFGFIFAERFFVGQTSNPQIIKYGTQYLFVCTVFSFGMFLQIIMDRLLQSTGRTFYNMITQGTGAIINIILDPILIFGLFGFPRLEVTGAAIATVAGQIVGMTLSIIFNIKVNKDIHLTIKGFKPHLETIKKIYAVGLPSIIMQSITSVMTFGINKILIMFTSTAVSVFGVYFKMQSFVFMPVFGLNNGMVPIVAYNYGAKKKKRIIQTVKMSIVIATGIMLFGFAIFQIFPAQLLKMFNATDDMLTIGTYALRIISISFIFAGFCIILLSVFQALGHGMLSLIVSLIRQLVVILPVAFILAKLGGLHAVWYAFPIADIFSVTFSIIFLRKIYHTTIKNLE
ncbi:MATE family efflux transporter [Candidatus Galacturonibacter soehngenii]|uniref:MATE family efflux transporter n=1 Tax=Candidatus Galacturonatibacter soehngenii TaxID=2307010 RepID=A0A7V7QNE8_9FIRM|nr:MATE family efflux transporter [Candidatus Galacturonibacter soehngenii]KAB1440115.1 MATE family efflux transporter [Candidatus Galacturonibacter soehngenii]